MKPNESLVDLPADVSGKVLFGKVWRLAWPSIAEFSLLLAVGLSDVFLIGHLSKSAQAQLGYDNASALAATSAGQFFNWTVNAALIALGIAAMALVARNIGAGDRNKASIFGRHALFMALLFGLVLSVVALLIGKTFIYLLGAEGQLVDLGYKYLSTTAYALPMSAMMITGNGALRGSGDTRTPLFIMLCVNVINIIVAWLLINGQFGLPVMGIEGSALGAVSGWSVGAILVITRLLGLWPGSSRRQFRIELNFHVKMDYIRELIRFGLPTFGEQMVFQIGLFFFARFIVGLGTLTYAAHSAIINIDSAAFLPGQGIATATTILVGQALGANRPDLARRYTLAAWQMGLIFMGFMGMLFLAFPEFFLRLLVDNEAVIATATNPLRIAGIFDPFIATSFILIGALRGAGDTKFPMYARMLGTWFLRVGLAVLFIQLLGMGLLGGRLAMGLDSVAVALFVYWRFRSGKWQAVWASKKQSRAIAPTMPSITLKERPALTPATASPDND